MFDGDDEAKPDGSRYIKYWIAIIFLIFILTGCIMLGIFIADKQTADNRHIQWITSNTTPINAEFNNSINTNQTKVITGMYIDRITELSLAESFWNVDFYVWFKWNGSNMNPGDNLQVIDGAIEKKELIDNYTNGSQHYEIYYINANISKFFDILTFPIDAHVLTITLEDSKNQRNNLVYLPDSDASSINPDVEINGYKLGKLSLVEKPHVYTTNFGDPRLSDGNTSYSQILTGVEISRPDLGFYFRIFIGLFVAVAAALVALFIKPTNAEPRFGLGAGALFVAIANNIITSGLIPKTGIITLADMVNDLGLLLILLTLIESTISLYIYDIRGEKAVSKRLDLISFLVLLTLYIILNILIIISVV